MKRHLPPRRGFADPPIELMMVMMVVGLTISVALPFFTAARSAGWPWWLAAGCFPLSLLAVAAYMLGIPFAAAWIAKRSRLPSEEEWPQVWFGVLLAATWLTGVVLFTVIAFTAHKWFSP